MIMKPGNMFEHKDPIVNFGGQFCYVRLKKFSLVIAVDHTDVLLLNDGRLLTFRLGDIR